MMIKKIIATLLIGSLAVSLIGCSSTIASDGDTKSEDIEIVCTTFPQYDWVREVIGDVPGVEVTLLMDNGGDLHNYEPTVDDMIKITSSDLFIYVGGESDYWVEDVLAQADTSDVYTMNMVEVLGEAVKETAHVEGMEEHSHTHAHDEETCTDPTHDHSEEEHEEHAHDHEGEEHEEHAHDHEGEEHEEHAHAHEGEEHEEHAHDHEGEEHEEHAHDHEEETCTDPTHDHGEEGHVDEHVWLSLRNAQVLTQEIADILATIDPIHAEDYKVNAVKYYEELATLDSEYGEMVGEAANKTLLFADRFPFRYLVDDYDLAYYAAFSGCSAETEASFETVAFLTQQVEELNLDTVFVIDQPTNDLAETIVKNTESKDQTVQSLNSMQSITKHAIEEGATYLNIMEYNFTILEEALN